MSGRLPRVTAVLADLGLGPDLSRVAPDVLEVARERGAAVHRAVEALTYGYYDEADVHPDAAPYVAAYQKFVAESGFQPIAAEIEVTHPVWRFRGHPDVIGWLNGRRGVIDVKTGVSDGAAYQVAAYCDAWSAERPQEPVLWGAILHLHDDRGYRLEDVSLPAALPVWRAALIVYTARKELGR